MQSLKEYIVAQMEKLGIQPKKALGQNFLVGESVVQNIIKRVQKYKPQTMIEVGPGLGSLTYFLRQMPEIDLTLIELDQKFADMWRQEGLKVIEKDALHVSFAEFVQKSKPVILVSNLPYQISSSIVIERCLDVNPLDAMVLMFQKEVAQKIRGKVGDELYGMLSVMAQTFWKIETVCEAGSREFLPAPKVTSRVLAFEKIESKVKDKKKYLRFLKACYSHPRKLLISNLESAYSVPRSKSIEYLTVIKKSEKVRAEELTVAEMIDFFHFVV